VTDPVTDPMAPVAGGVRPERLRRSDDVRHTLRRGRSRAGAQLAVHVLVRPETAQVAPAHSVPGSATRLTVVASKRVGGAVRRNRAKRLMREAARTRPWRAGLDVVLVARGACADSDVHRVGDELERLAVQLDALVERDVPRDVPLDAPEVRA
jgi:ribonuclease P protein component